MTDKPIALPEIIRYTNYKNDLKAKYNKITEIQ